MKKKNCWLPYYHADVSNKGITKPCCKIISPKWSTNFEEYQTIDRSEFESETLPISCNACNVGPLDYSYNKQRMIFWDKMKWPDPEKVSIKSLNINLDNVCASSCIMCSSEHSTTIAALRGENKKIILDVDSITPYLDNLELLHISGGEPLQSPNLVKFCEKLKHTNIKSISICSGLSSKILTKNLDALCNLNIPIYCRVSIDAPWPLNSWIRGLKQSDWEQNLSIVKSRGMEIGWTITIGAYNVFAIPELLDYLENLYPNKHIACSPIINPNSHSAKQLPLDYKLKIISKLEKQKQTEIINTSISLLNKENDMNWDDCKRIMEQLPILRKEPYNLEHFIKMYI